RQIRHSARSDCLQQVFVDHRSIPPSRRLWNGVMTTRGNPTTACRRAPALSLALAMALASATLSAAGDTAPEHAQLAALARQLDLLERTAHHSASIARYERARYHFDYARLHQDIVRIR